MTRLINELESFLGHNNIHQAVIIVIGKLGYDTTRLYVIPKLWAEYFPGLLTFIIKIFQ